jgi:predicted HTH domain antitoxin
MVVSIELPDAIAKQLHLDGAQGNRRGLEVLVLDGYRSGELSRGQVSEILGLSLWETEALLKEHGIGLGMTFDEFEQSTERARKFLAK